MPFESKAQARYLYAVHPDIAKEFAAKTKSMAGLPEHVKGGSAGAKKRQKPTVPNHGQINIQRA